MTAQAPEAASSTLCARLENVSKLFGSFAALRQVSVDLEPGRCYVLIGENGAGKSTLLAHSGRPACAPPAAKSRSSATLNPHDARERIGYMSHAPMLYDELTAQENLRYFASLYPGRHCLDPAEALRQVGLDPDLTRPLGQYSQGMRQRTSLARVLLPVPELLLLDEPFSNMDVESTRQMVELLAGFRQSNRTIVITTHQREHAAPIADWVLRLQGRPRRDLRTGESDAMKTNGARFLESLGIPFELREYEVDPEDLSAITVAKKIGMPPEQVFKTLLMTGGPNIYRFAVIPGDAELDFKKLARAAGLRKAEMAPLKDVQPLTGYIRGGVTLFGAQKAYPVYIDETAILFDKISVSAGARGTQLILSPDDYLRAAQALEVEVQTADLTKRPPAAREPGAPSPASGTWDSRVHRPRGQKMTAPSGHISSKTSASSGAP